MDSRPLIVRKFILYIFQRKMDNKKNKFNHRRRRKKRKRKKNLFPLNEDLLITILTTFYQPGQR